MMCVMCSKWEGKVYVLAFIHGPVGKVGDGESGPDRRMDFKVFQLLDCVYVCSLHTIPALLYMHCIYFVCIESLMMCRCAKTVCNVFLSLYHLGDMFMQCSYGPEC